MSSARGNPQWFLPPHSHPHIRASLSVKKHRRGGKSKAKQLCTRTFSSIRKITRDLTRLGRDRHVTPCHPNAPSGPSSQELLKKRCRGQRLAKSSQFIILGRFLWIWQTIFAWPALRGWPGLHELANSWCLTRSAWLAELADFGCLTKCPIYARVCKRDRKDTL